jgi:hypothetical protein
VIGLAGLKTISIVLLMLALVGASPVLAQPDGASLVLTPTEGCPGTIVSLVLFFTGSPDDIQISSSPDGLFNPEGLFVCRLDTDGVSTLTCTREIFESACSGRYRVTVSVEGGSASAYFDVPSTCPGVRSCAVGGCVQPVNKLALLSPWLAVIGLAGCIGVVGAVVKRRQS